MESLFDQTDNMGINLLDLAKEVVESALPLTLMLLGENISVEGLELFDLLLNFFCLSIDHGGITSDSLEIWTKNGVELLDDDTSLFEIVQNCSHVD